MRRRKWESTYANYFQIRTGWGTAYRVKEIFERYILREIGMEYAKSEAKIIHELKKETKMIEDKSNPVQKNRRCLSQNLFQ